MTGLKHIFFHFFEEKHYFGHELMSFLWLYLQVVKMLKWKEREHEMNDFMDLEDQGTIDALGNCGLLKFFLCPNMTT